MFRRLVCMGLLAALVLPMCSIGVLATSKKTLTATDLRASTTEDVDLYEAVSRSNRDYVTFYRDEGCTDKVTDPSGVRLSTTTRFYVQRSYDDGSLSNVAGFFVYTGFDLGSISLAASLSGSTVRLTATVTRVSGRPAPTGEIIFTEGDHEIGRVALSTTRATLNWDYPGPGDYLFSATYSGDDNYRTMAAHARLSRDGTGTTSAAAASPASTETAEEKADPALEVYRATHVRQAAADPVALAKSAGASTAVVTLTGEATVTREAMQELTDIAERENLTLRCRFDTQNQAGGVASRISVDVTAGTAYKLSGFNTGADTSSAAIAPAQRIFSRYFQNKVAIAKLAEQAGFGIDVDIALRLNTDGMDNLHFYLYDLEANRYVPLTGSLDSAGYVHVKTDRGGYVIVSDGPLAAA